jgi:uncharacterized protein YqgV (UPF0045/DUF77 family)
MTRVGSFRLPPTLLLKIVDGSGLPYLLSPTATCSEGDWDQVMDLIRECHEHARQRSAHVITTIKIGDEAGAENKLFSNVSAVKVNFMFLQRDRYQLDILRMLLEREQIQPVIDSILPLNEVAEAHRRLEAGGVKGKIVLRVREE